MSVKVTIDENKGTLTVVADLIKKPQPSKSGKSLTIATTNGIMNTEHKYSGGIVRVGLNAFIPNPDH